MASVAPEALAKRKYKDDDVIKAHLLKKKQRTNNDVKLNIVVAADDEKHVKFRMLQTDSLRLLLFMMSHGDLHCQIDPTQWMTKQDDRSAQTWYSVESVYLHAHPFTKKKRGAILSGVVHTLRTKLLELTPTCVTKTSVTKTTTTASHIDDMDDGHVHQWLARDSLVKWIRHDHLYPSDHIDIELKKLIIPAAFPAAQERSKMFAKLVMEEYIRKPFAAPREAVMVLDSEGRNTFALIEAGLPASCILLPEMNLNTATYHLLLSLAVPGLRPLFCPAHARSCDTGVDDLLIRHDGVHAEPGSWFAKHVGITSLPCVYLDFMGGLPVHLDKLIDVLKRQFKTRILGLTRGKRNTAGGADFPAHLDKHEIPDCRWNQRTVECRFYRL